jgi:hypothetical protein
MSRISGATGYRELQVGDGPGRIDLRDNLLGTPRILPSPTFGQKRLGRIFDGPLNLPFGERGTQSDQLIRYRI